MAGDRDQAQGLLDRGRATAQELGMRPLADRIETALATVKEGPAERPDGLTEREVEILRLIARGLTSKEIGAELFIATKTVASHLRNIYEKAGLTNRAEATAYAIQHGLTKQRNED